MKPGGNSDKKKETAGRNCRKSVSDSLDGQQVDAGIARERCACVGRWGDAKLPRARRGVGCVCGGWGQGRGLQFRIRHYRRRGHRHHHHQQHHQHQSSSSSPPRSTSSPSSSSSSSALSSSIYPSALMASGFRTQGLRPGAWGKVPIKVHRLELQLPTFG